METQHKKEIENIFRFMNSVLFIEKKFTFQFKKVTLFPKEVHAILLIAQEPAINGKAMAEQLGVTKGAISQTLTRLEKKGVLYKEKKPGSKNEIQVRFTSLGQEAVEHYTKFKSMLEQHYNDCLSQFTDQERVTINDFLVRLNKIINHI